MGEEVAVRVEVNGTPREVPDGATLADLLRLQGLSAEQVAVEVNRDVVPRAEHAARCMREGDRIEIVTFVGGG